MEAGEQELKLIDNSHVKVGVMGDDTEEDEVLTSSTSPRSTSLERTVAA